MAAVTYTPKQVAARLTERLGRNVNPKQVRALARGDASAPVLPRFADEGYTSHLYTTAERDKLERAFEARSARRAPAEAAAPTTARKVRKGASGTGTRKGSRKAATAVQPAAAGTPATDA